MGVRLLRGCLDLICNTNDVNEDCCVLLTVNNKDDDHHLIIKIANGLRLFLISPNLMLCDFITHDMYFTIYSKHFGKVSLKLKYKKTL